MEKLVTFSQTGSNLNYDERNFIASSIDNIFF